MATQRDFALSATLLSILLTTAPSARGSPVQGSTHRILNQLESAWPRSVAGPMATTSDGDLLYVAESGVVAVIDADDQGSYEDPIKLEKISSHGVRAVELILDSEADVVGDPEDEKSVLYVAGGRQGLWVMQADPRENEPMPAARIDDAADATAHTIQDNRRWCNDVTTMQLGEDSYLVGLFAQWGCTHVRFYPLEDARGVLADNPGEETGNELEAALEVKFGGNCTYQQPRHESFGLGLAVDDSDEDETFVYVAMGPYGLVRIRFTDPTNILAKQVTDGPWFGNGSYYANNITGGPFGGIYNNFQLILGDSTIRNHPPYFCDVALQYDGANKYLWCAVDHLGILRFNVSSPSSWSASMTINHQEGLKKTSGDLSSSPCDETTVDAHVRLINEDDDTTVGEPASVNVRNYAHRIRVANQADPPALAVAVAMDPFILSDSILNEGRTLGHLGNAANGIPPNLDPPLCTRGENDYTVIYDLSALVPVPPADTTATPAYQHTAFLRVGGRSVHLPEVHPADELLVFGGRWDPLRPLFYFEDIAPSQAHNTTFRGSYDWPAGTLSASPFERLAADRPGRLCYDICFSQAKPELIYFGSNDDAVAPDGFLATCDGEFHRIDYQPSENGIDNRATFGIIMNPHAVWPDGTGNEFIWGVAKHPTDGPLWELVEMDVGDGLCDDPPASPPNREKRIFIEAPLDNFLSRGRGYYGVGELNLDYDDFVGTEFSGEELIFGSRLDTPAGLVVLNRATVEDQITVLANDATVGASVATFRELLTHPEFSNVYYDPTPPVNWLGPTNTNGPTTPNYNPYGTGLVGRVSTYVPRLLQVPAPTGSTYSEHWILAVPSAAVQLPPDLPTFTDDTFGQYEPGWAPDSVYVTNYDRAMVRVFDVNDWNDVTDDQSTVPDYTLIGPRDTTAAARIESLRWNDRDYLFVVDFAGSVLVWDATELLEEDPGTVITSALTGYEDFLVEEWLAPPCVSDDVGNNVWSVAVDVATWTDAGGQHEEVYVYVLVGRVGIEVLRFDPSEDPGDRLEWVERIEVPYGQGGLLIRVDQTDDTVRTLLVADSLGGVRMFGYGN